MAFFLPAALVVVLDQLSKRLIWRHGQDHDFVPGYLHLTLVKNSGAAFGLFQGGRVVFILASVVAAAFIVYVAVRLPRHQWARKLYLGLILGGAVGNLVDRAFAGEVIDFIQIGVAGHYWPVFNVADTAVTVGALLLVVDLWRRRGRAADAVAGETPAGTDEPSHGL